ncbi:hypothetical protein ACOME3_006017 [Neoechinorhynchus agilis]
MNLQPLLNDQFVISQSQQGIYRRFCWILTPVLGLGFHVFIGTIMITTNLNVWLGVWCFVTGILAIPILVVQCLDWNNYWNDRRTTRNVCGAAVIIGMAGSSFCSARLTNLIVSRSIKNWSPNSHSWFLVFDASIVFWAILLYTIAKPKNIPQRPPSPILI